MGLTVDYTLGHSGPLSPESAQNLVRAATDRATDQLYGLTPEEIALVESATARSAT